MLLSNLEHTNYTFSSKAQDMLPEDSTIPIYLPVLEPGDTFQERYKIESILGQGGFGVVYSGVQISTGQKVAIKTLHPNSQLNTSLRFEAELKLLAQLNHPNIVKLVDSGTIDTQIFMVLEFIEGMDLSAFIKQRGKLSPKLTQRITLHILEALCEAHKLGIIHRDLKPANIMLTSSMERPIAKLLDFGISTVSQNYDGEWETMTTLGTMPGTPSYIAPELLKPPTAKKPNTDTLFNRNGQGWNEVLEPHTPKQPVANERSDIYALGLIMLECLTGVKAVQGSTPIEVALKQISDTIEIPQDILNQPLGRIIQKACEKNPDKRYKSASEMLIAVEAATTEFSNTPRSPSPKKPPILTIFAILLGIFVIALVLVLSMKPNDKTKKNTTTSTTTKSLPPQNKIKPAKPSTTPKTIPTTSKQDQTNKETPVKQDAKVQIDQKQPTTSKPKNTTPDKTPTFKKPPTTEKKKPNQIKPRKKPKPNTIPTPKYVF